MRILIKIISLIIAAVIPTAAIAIPTPGQGVENHRDSVITASLITCYPGPEIYELCGHEALRIRGAGIDTVWNYGVFDFAEPNFVGRFVKGETDYMLAGVPFQWFIKEYEHRGSKVVEQDLNLSEEQTMRLLDMLREESLPGNNRYRYNYIRNNCATRIIDRLQQATDSTIILNDTIRYKTFREEMRHFHKNYPWYQFGIDLALGSGLDMEMKKGQQMFAPMEMMVDAGSMKFKDGTPLVKEQRVIYEGRGDVTEGPTGWWLTPMAIALYMLVLTIGICIYDAKKQRISRWWWSIYYGLAGVAGCVITFLVFFSTHDSTSPNLLICWLNPLQLIIAAGIWSRYGRPAVTVMSWLNLLTMIILLVAWPFQPQAANPAFFPLMGCNILLSATWAIISHKISYNKEEKSAPSKRVHKKSPVKNRTSPKRKSTKKK